MGGESWSSPVNQTCGGRAGSLSSAGETWLPCEEAEEWVYYIVAHLDKLYSKYCIMPTL